MILSNPRAVLIDTVGFVRFLGRRLLADRCQDTAASLTWVSLFALVPLLTVFYTILSMVPAFQALGGSIEDLVFRHFVPATGGEIQQYLTSFADQARRLTVAGTSVLFVSAWLMLRNIEASFNRIWRVRQKRRGVARFLVYWAILSLGPLLAGAGVLLSTYLFSLDAFNVLPESARLKSGLLGALPELLSFVSFTLLFVAVPNCRVRLRHAALGGLVVMLLFETAKAMFGWAVARGSYTLVYGAFAALPLFMLWLYFSWLLLLAGAEFVYALENYRGHRQQQFPDLISALVVLERLYELHQKGEVLHDEDILALRALPAGHTLEPERWEKIRQQMIDMRLLRETQQGEYMLGTDAGQVMLWDIYRVFGPVAEVIETQILEQLPPWMRAVAVRLAAAESNLRDALACGLAEAFSAGEHGDAKIESNAP